MWQINITLDETTTGVGNCSGTWKDEDGTTFSFSARAGINEVGQAKFLAAANEALEAWKAKAATEKALAAALTAKANEGVA